MRNRKTQLYIPVDLAAVCSVAFLLLLLYISMAGYKPEEPVEINMPETSGTRCNIDGFGQAIILLGEGKIFLYLEDTLRKDALKQIGLKYNIRFTKQHIDRFRHVKYIGQPAAAFTRDVMVTNLPGLTLQKNNNELEEWITAANKVYHSIHESNIRVAIKADKDTGYPLIKKVIAILQDQHINRFSFITNTKLTRND